ncbi:hypothetical protein LBMAG53_40100 [Planctomycetota bacterium]|nr:hypothetical protein LBMAG53_40100 [Planctomycetota bacterium]
MPIDRATLAGDRLYSIAFRPQELALLGGAVAIDVRYAAIADPGDPPVTRHFRLLVVEVTAQVPASEFGGSAGDPPRAVQLLKIGWELELATTTPCPAAGLGTSPKEAPLLAGRIADTVNDLAKRAGIDPPISPDLRREIADRCLLSVH